MDRKQEIMQGTFGISSQLQIVNGSRKSSECERMHTLVQCLNLGLHPPKGAHGLVTDVSPDKAQIYQPEEAETHHMNKSRF